MRLEGVTAEIRPRTDWEAVDLGFALVRRDFWRCLVMWWMPVLPLVLAAAWWVRDVPLVLVALVWWAKPAGSRLVLFQLSRRLFGEMPSWRRIWREVPRVWTRRFGYRFLWARFSPWLPLTLAIGELEGLRGKEYRQRAAQLVRRGDGVMIWCYLLADLAACWLGMGMLGVVMMLIPEGQGGSWQMSLGDWAPGNPLDFPASLLWTGTLCMLLGMSLVDLFLTGAGFGLYVNNRTWLEGWDVELAFRRLGQRLGGVAVAALLALLVVSPVVCRAQETRPPASQVIEEVKAGEEFQIQKIKERVVVRERRSEARKTPPWLSGAGSFLGWLFLAVTALLVALFAGWLAIRRGVPAWRRGPAAPRQRGEGARVLLGVELAPQSLPADVPAACWALWQQGKRQEALGLLYRGAIVQLTEREGVEIQASDTEEDCLRRMESAGSAAYAGYFRGVTGVWVRSAYAGVMPEDREVEGLCRAWPFAGERVR